MPISCSLQSQSTRGQGRKIAGVQASWDLTERPSLNKQQNPQNTNRKNQVRVANVLQFPVLIAWKATQRPRLKVLTDFSLCFSETGSYSVAQAGSGCFMVLPAQCPSFISGVMIKRPSKSKLGEGGYYSSEFQVLIHPHREVKSPGTPSSWTHCT